MSRAVRRNNVKESKKAINKELAQMEKDLMKSSNPLDQLKVLNRAEEILEAEIFAWTAMLEEEMDCPAEEMENLVNSATPHIAVLHDLIKTIEEYRIPLLDGAKAVYNARKNSNLDPGHVKHITHEK